MFIKSIFSYYLLQSTLTYFVKIIYQCCKNCSKRKALLLLTTNIYIKNSGIFSVITEPSSFVIVGLSTIITG